MSRSRDEKRFFDEKLFRRKKARSAPMYSPARAHLGPKREGTDYLCVVCRERKRSRKKVVVSVHFSPVASQTVARRATKRRFCVNTRTVTRDPTPQTRFVKSRTGWWFVCYFAVALPGRAIPPPARVRDPRRDRDAARARRARSERAARRAADEGGGRGRRPPRDLSVLVFRRARR